MSMDDNWSNLLPEILILIFNNLELLSDCLRFISVCKSWNHLVISGLEIPCLPPTRYPFLLLAEDVAPGALISNCDYDSDEEGCYNFSNDEDVKRVAAEDEEDSNEDDEEEDNNEDDEEEDSNEDDEDDNVEEDSNEDDEDDSVEEDSNEDDEDDSVEEDSNEDDEDDSVEEDSNEDDEDDSVEEDSDDEEEEEKGEDTCSVVAGAEEDNRGGGKYNYLNNTIGTNRGLYSLLTGKTYVLDLPEAAGRLILGTNIGWLVTLGRDLQLNLLHPLLRSQISLPPILSFPRQFEYSECHTPEEASDYFIYKVAVSSKIPNKNTPFGLYRHQTSPSPVVMTLYGPRQYLGFARLGDQVWTDVKFPLSVSCNGVYDQANFEDIAYHRGNFYVVDCHGGIFVCGSDDNEQERGDIRGRQIASFETKDWLKKYLVESSSGSGLWLLVRYHKEKYHNVPKYRTTSFSVWRLDLKNSDSFEEISCTLKEEKDLGNEAIFIGRASSVAVSSSETIKPNSIYFTDDKRESYHRKGGGHDMGIFNIEHRTIESHFPGKSIHPISPPLWYF